MVSYNTLRFYLKFDVEVVPFPTSNTHFFFESSATPKILINASNMTPMP